MAGSDPTKMPIVDAANPCLCGKRGIQCSTARPCICLPGCPCLTTPVNVVICDPQFGIRHVLTPTFNGVDIV